MKKLIGFISIIMLTAVSSVSADEVVPPFTVLPQGNEGTMWTKSVVDNEERWISVPVTLAPVESEGEILETESSQADDSKTFFVSCNAANTDEHWIVYSRDENICITYSLADYSDHFYPKYGSDYQKEFWKVEAQNNLLQSSFMSHRCLEEGERKDLHDGIWYVNRCQS